MLPDVIIKREEKRKKTEKKVNKSKGKMNMNKDSQENKL